MARPARTLRLAPSLLSADFAHLAEAVLEAERGGADAFHLDVMDGHFVPNLTFGPALVRSVRAVTKLPLDIHLMIERPTKFAEAFAKAGGDTLVFHVEASDGVEDSVRAIRAAGAAVGAAIRPDTPFDRVASWVGRLDQVLVMSVMPGFSGQAFRPEVLPKVRAARDVVDASGSTADISIDGGITPETAVAAASHGATFFVCGNSVFTGGTVGANLGRLREAIDAGATREVR
ncbi:MAG: ribulose-phosphate 3-epimerase [Thermoplasmata archaeon]|nr:ribulose-phosphate 3-epimerase [Thermoplasmata archaeon]